MAVQTHVCDAPLALGCLFHKQPGLPGPVVRGQPWAGFGCPQVTWEVGLFSKPHQGGALQFHPEPPPELGQRGHSSKTDADRRIQNRKGDHKSTHKRGDPQRPLFKKSGFVLVIHVQGRLECGEFTFIHQAPRGQRASLEEVTTWRRNKKDRSLGHQASPSHTAHTACRKEGALSSRHPILSNMCLYFGFLSREKCKEFRHP